MICSPRGSGRRWSWLGVAALLASVAPTSCATSGGPGGTGGAAMKSFTAADYYPLDQGWKWAYDLEKDGQKILAMYAVLARTSDTAIIQAGDDRLIYAITPEGIAQKEGLGADTGTGAILGDYVIKNPVALGATWSVVGGTAKIVAVGQEVTVEAGKFPNCAIVEVTRAAPARVARTTFAPGVGPIAIELQVQAGAGFAAVTRATLRAVTRPGEDPLH